MSITPIQELWIQHTALAEEVARLRKAMGKLEEHSHELAKGVRRLQERSDAVERALRALGRPPSGTFAAGADEEPTAKRKRPAREEP
jgi:hypothetical protein